MARSTLTKRQRVSKSPARMVAMGPISFEATYITVSAVLPLAQCCISREELHRIFKDQIIQDYQATDLKYGYGPRQRSRGERGIGTLGP